MWFVVLVTLIPLLLVVSNRWRMDVAALFIMISLGLAQFLGYSILADGRSPGQTLLAISGFSQPVVVTLMGLFILTQTLSHNGVMLWLGHRLLRAGQNSEKRLVFLLTLIASFLSLFMNNIAVGALLLPSALQVARKAGVAPSKLLIPIAFGTSLGGMATYFTTANIVISNLLMGAQPPQQPLGILSFAPTGALIAITGISFIVFWGRRILPTRDPGAEQELARRTSAELENLYEVGDRLWEARVEDFSPLVGQTLQESAIGEKFGITVTALKRGARDFVSPRSNEAIQSGDVLLLVGREERISKLTHLDVKIHPETKAITTFGIALIELILAPHSAYVGKTIKELNFRRKYGFTIVALLRRGRNYRTDVGDIPLELGDSFLILGPSDRRRDLRINPDIIILEPDPASDPIPRRRALISILLFFGAVTLSLLGLPVYLSVLTAALVAILFQLLPVQDVYRSIEWQVIFFIAGMYIASLGMVHTGFANLIGQAAIGLLGSAGPLGLAAAAFLFSAALTQFMGSQATAFIVGPIAISAAIHLNTDPRAIAVAAATGCSAAFLTSIAHPVNLIMISPGNYRSGDFFRVGLGLTLVTFFALLAGMILFWHL